MTGPARRQQGAILLVCLVLLALLSLLAGDALETGLVQERMAGNLRDQELALQAAESALMEAEGWLAAQTALPDAAVDGSAAVWRRDAPEQACGGMPWWAACSADWWRGQGRAAGAWPGLADTPRFLIEEYAAVDLGQALNADAGAESRRRILHRITARGVGARAGSVVLLQTTFLGTYD